MTPISDPGETGSSPEESRVLFARCEEGDEAAAAGVVARYSRRLLGLVRERLSPVVQRRFDPDDVVQSAYRSFFLRARDGRFRCDRPGELWRLLSAITVNKLRRRVARHTADRRHVLAERSIDDLSGFAPAAAEPGPATMLAIAEELNALAPTDRERDVLERRMQGATNAEIADELGCAERTVRRVVDGIRDRVSRRIAADRHADSPLRVGGPGTVDERDLLLHQLVGAGGVGKVYRATHRPTGETVAVKFLRRALADSPFVLERFRIEAETLATLSHVGIVRIRGIGASRTGLPFLVTDWHERGDLTRLLGRCTSGEAIAMTISIADALDHAHERGIVHCDLKPGNVLLGTTGPVVVDFGHAVRPVLDRRAVGGTKGYTAPEVLADPRVEIDFRADVYGLGAILHALLAGGPPGTVPAPPDAPVGLANVLARALADDPADRHATAGMLATALGRLVVEPEGS